MDAGPFGEGLKGDLQNMLVAKSPPSHQLCNYLFNGGTPLDSNFINTGVMLLGFLQIPRTKHSA